MRLIAWIGIRPWLIGVLASAAAMFLGYELGSEIAKLFGGEPELLARIGKGFAWGGVIGALQWPVVRTVGVPPMRFLMASAVGFAAGYPLGQTIQLTLAFQWSLHWGGYAMALATFGLCLGLLQWWAFRRQIPRSGRWILFSVAAWMLSGAVATGPRIDALDSGVYGLVAGLGLVWLVRTRRPRGAAGAVTATN